MLPSRRHATPLHSLRGGSARDVPRDVALVGFDDIEAAALVTPALTTVLNPADQLGAVAGRLLRDRMNGYAGPRRQVVISHEFIQRDSA